MQSKLRGGRTNLNAYNQFLITAERNRGHMYCPMPSKFIQRKKSGLRLEVHYWGEPERAPHLMMCTAFSACLCACARAKPGWEREQLYETRWERVYHVHVKLKIHFCKMDDRTAERLQRRTEYDWVYRRQRAATETPQEKETRLERLSQRVRERRAAQPRGHTRALPERLSFHALQRGEESFQGGSD